MTDYQSQSRPADSVLLFPKSLYEGEVVRPMTRGNPSPYTAAGAFCGLPLGFLVLERSVPTVLPNADYQTQEFLDLREFWFEIIHVIPTFFHLGNILTTIIDTITLYNADRFASHSLDTFVNNAGTGVTVPDLPSLPETIPTQSGLQVTLTVSPLGPPSIDGNLEFGFDLYMIPVQITGDRIILLPFEPESPVVEVMEFLTDVLVHIDETEQRISGRKNPRQSFNLDFFREEGVEMSRFDFLMFGWQSKVFGLPVWVEPTSLTTQAQVGETTIQVESTDYADYRVGGLAVIYNNETDFESLEVSGITATSVSFTSPLTKDFAVDTLVMPVRTAIAQRSIKGKRSPVNATNRSVQMRIIDNDVGDSFADTSPFIIADVTSPIDGEIFLPGPNRMEGQLSESFDHELTVFDGSTGKFSHSSRVSFNRRGTSWGILTKNRQQLWETRRLLHGLNGKQVSFFVPTFFRDLIVSQSVSSGASTLTIHNVGYSRYVAEQGRYEFVRITLTDGTTYDAQITGSGELSESEEQLTVSVTAPRDILASEFRRIDFIEKVRIDTDVITLNHIDAAGQATISFPVRSVNE